MPWPRLAETYGRTVTSIGNALVDGGPVESGAMLRFDAPRSPAGSDENVYGTELSARSTNGAFVRVPIDLRTLTFIPTAVFIALALASPIWKGSRGTILLLSGLVILQLFLAGSVAVPLLFSFRARNRCSSSA